MVRTEVENDTIKKFEIEAALRSENEEIKAGRLKEDNPVETGEDFVQLCLACRRGDLKTCQEQIQLGVNINARDQFDYTPLILASLCGHFEVCQLLIERGALCERDTFQGERALYNALNDRIRNLLLSYDYSKSRDPLQPLAGHITSLLHRQDPATSDITLTTFEKDFKLHKFVLAARSPYFARKLATTPETTSWKVPHAVPTRSMEIAIQVMYFLEVNLDFSDSEADQAVLVGIEKLGRQLEIGDLLDTILESDRRKARQKRTQEVEKGRDQLDAWFQSNIVKHQIRADVGKARSVQWDRQNSIFADCLLYAADDDDEEVGPQDQTEHTTAEAPALNSAGIPVGPVSSSAAASMKTSKQATLVPAHRAMLLRSDYFLAMFTSPFREAQPTPHLPIIHVDCSPEVLLIILSHLYTESCTIPLHLAIPTLFAADLLFIDKLKVSAATIISTLGNGSASIVEAESPRGEIDEPDDEIDVYDVIRAGWDTRVHRLEEFGARFIAYRLERYIEEEEFQELVKESAARIKGRQETDTVELVDDIRYYLSERFRLRFEDVGFDEMEGEAQGTDGTTLVPSDQNSAAPGQSLSGDRASALPGAEGVMMTLDGELAGDEFAQDALKYQILLGKIDTLLEGLHLDA